VISKRVSAVLAAVTLLSACSPGPEPTAAVQTSVPSIGPEATTPTATTVALATEPPPSAEPSLSPTTAPTSGPDALTGQPGGVYWATIDGQIQSSWAKIPERVYVPDERSGDVVVIDPATFKVIGRFKVGASPEHITPAWDGGVLYVNNMNSGSMTEIDPQTGRPNGTVIKVPNPYNLYFTPDGTRAIVVEDMSAGAPTDPNGLLFLDPKSWKKIGFVPIPWAGADHLDFSADGKTIFLSTEFAGRIVAVDVDKMKVITSLRVGGSPTDVRLSPDGSVVFVANQVRNEIDIVNTTTLQYAGFIQAGVGAHGLGISRDTTKLFVTNRLAASVSVIDIATRKVVATWSIGGTPDMIAQSPDGSQLWISDRYSGYITVVNAQSGAVIKKIDTGVSPHGLAYWPQPGRYSLGHNGNMR
jgi:YVTN family beta-propeller protein